MSNDKEEPVYGEGPGEEILFGIDFGSGVDRIWIQNEEGEWQPLHPTEAQINFIEQYIINTPPEPADTEEVEVDQCWGPTTCDVEASAELQRRATSRRRGHCQPSRWDVDLLG